MTGSHASQSSRWAVLAVLALAVWGSSAQAQQTPPIQLAPQKLAPPTATAPKIVAPPVATADQATAPEKTNNPAGTGGVQVGNLQNIDPDSTGILSEAQGGFGAEMWLGTDRAIVEKLLPQLPISSSSAVMRELMRRLLLSIARVPEGKSSGLSLVATRIKLLVAMGDLVAVNTLLNATPGRATNAELARIGTEIRFLSNDNARACAQAGGQIRNQDVDFWQKAFFFCQALAGEHD